MARCEMEISSMQALLANTTLPEDRRFLQEQLISMRQQRALQEQQRAALQQQAIMQEQQRAALQQQAIMQEQQRAALQQQQQAIMQEQQRQDRANLQQEEINQFHCLLADKAGKAIILQRLLTNCLRLPKKVVAAEQIAQHTTRAFDDLRNLIIYGPRRSGKTVALAETLRAVAPKIAGNTFFFIVDLKCVFGRMCDTFETMITNYMRALENCALLQVPDRDRVVEVCQQLGAEIRAVDGIHDRLASLASAPIRLAKRLQYDHFLCGIDEFEYSYVWVAQAEKYEELLSFNDALRQFLLNAEVSYVLTGTNAITLSLALRPNAQTPHDIEGRSGTVSVSSFPIPPELAEYQVLCGNYLGYCIQARTGLTDLQFRIGAGMEEDFALSSNVLLYTQWHQTFFKLRSQTLAQLQADALLDMAFYCLRLCQGFMVQENEGPFEPLVLQRLGLLTCSNPEGPWHLSSPLLRKALENYCNKIILAPGGSHQDLLRTMRTLVEADKGGIYEAVLENGVSRKMNKPFQLDVWAIDEGHPAPASLQLSFGKELSEWVDFPTEQSLIEAIHQSNGIWWKHTKEKGLLQGIDTAFLLPAERQTISVVAVQYTVGRLGHHKVFSQTIRGFMELINKTFAGYHWVSCLEAEDGTKVTLKEWGKALVECPRKQADAQLTLTQLEQRKSEIMDNWVRLMDKSADSAGFDDADCAKLQEIDELINLQQLAIEASTLSLPVFHKFWINRKDAAPIPCTILVVGLHRSSGWLRTCSGWKMVRFLISEHQHAAYCGHEHARSIFANPVIAAQHLCRELDIPGHAFTDESIITVHHTGKTKHFAFVTTVRIPIVHQAVIRAFLLPPHLRHVVYSWDPLVTDTLCLE
eukprot:TRINITY_DN1303_c0_g1_i8.p1 TRINITY_DN1303_c0_g1~~TRINITY_DN1303_c0_g1_i8.p1  ORF type:complete len:884 (-),score=152.75 TRINITY_DN1303_c0_g1_i8:118-2715(-)